MTQKEFNQPTFVITSAGGNATAIQLLDEKLTRARYSSLGKKLLQKMRAFSVEQTGFLIPSKNNFEMAGGEFCGNATLCAAVVFSSIQKKSRVVFTVSGYSETVRARVAGKGDSAYSVIATFPRFPIVRKQTSLSNGKSVTIVDLGGIVHVIIEAPFPIAFEQAQFSILRELGLEKRNAAGVIWIERDGGTVKINPVVRVKGAKTLFYEQSCGSGSIAVSAATGAETIIQPTGERIRVQITRKGVILQSEMRVVCVRPTCALKSFV